MKTNAKIVFAGFISLIFSMQSLAQISNTETLAPIVPTTPSVPTTAPNTAVNSSIPTAAQAVNQGTTSNGGTNAMGMALEVGGGVVFAVCAASAAAWQTEICNVGPSRVTAWVGMAIGAAAVSLGMSMQNGAAQSNAAIQSGVSTPLGINPNSNGGNLASSSNTTPITSSTGQPVTVGGIQVTPLAASAAVQKLAAAGVKIDPNTGKVTMPDGSTIDPKSALSGGGSGSSKISGADLAAGLKTMADSAAAAAQGADASSVAGDAMPGGGSAAPKSAKAQIPGFQMPTQAKAAAPGLRAVASVTGARILNSSGEPMAVASENLFSLIHNRVNSMISQDQLLTPDAATNPNGITPP